MKRFQRNQMHMLSQSISLAAGSRKTLLLSVFFFLTGISTGIFLELTMGAGEKSNIAGYPVSYTHLGQHEVVLHKAGGIGRRVRVRVLWK